MSDLRSALWGAPFFMSTSPTPRHRLEYAAFRVAESVVSHLPLNVAQGLGRGLGHFLHAVDARRRRVVRQNLRDADLGLDEGAVRRTAHESFAHLGALAFSTLRVHRMEREELLRAVHFEGLEHWDDARAAGRGFIGLTGHYGDWERMALALSAADRPLAVIGRSLDNPLLDPYLTGVRGRFGNTVIPKAGAFRDSLRVLRQGGCVGFLLDQDALTQGVFVRFLGRWASTFTSAAVLALKYGLPVVPIFSLPQGDGSLRVRILPALELHRTGDADQDVWSATQRMTSVIEDQIREDPRWWFWMHRRFKTRPGEGHPAPAPLPPHPWQAELASRQLRAQPALLDAP